MAGIRNTRKIHAKHTMELLSLLASMLTMESVSILIDNIYFHCKTLKKNISNLDPSRRGDLEILGYCLLQWGCGQLPWEDKLDDKNYVASKKKG